MSPSTSTSFPLVFKLALALVSVVAYAVIAELAETFEVFASLPGTSLWFHDLLGAIFGALVLAPYIGARQPVLRFVAICAASAAIYYFAVWFVTDGPIGYNMVTSFAAAGGAAALLSGLAVFVFAPRKFAWQLLPMTIAAGAVGGACFEFKFPFDQILLVGHGAWQLLVCIALHFGLREMPATTVAA